MTGRNYSLAVLAETARAEARRIEATQEALVMARLRAAADAHEVARAEQFDALARLADRCAADSVIMDRLRSAPVVPAAEPMPDEAEE